MPAASLLADGILRSFSMRIPSTRGEHVGDMIWFYPTLTGVRVVHYSYWQYWLSHESDLDTVLILPANLHTFRHYQPSRQPRCQDTDRLEQQHQNQNRDQDDFQ